MKRKIRKNNFNRLVNAPLFDNSDARQNAKPGKPPASVFELVNSNMSDVPRVGAKPGSCSTKQAQMGSTDPGPSSAWVQFVPASSSALPPKPNSHNKQSATGKRGKLKSNSEQRLGVQTRDNHQPAGQVGGVPKPS